jgi:hypothetical protein
VYPLIYEKESHWDWHDGWYYHGKGCRLYLERGQMVLGDRHRIDFGKIDVIWSHLSAFKIKLAPLAMVIPTIMPTPVIFLFIN